jgi:hypothetical protein
MFTECFLIPLCRELRKNSFYIVDRGDEPHIFLEYSPVNPFSEDPCKQGRGGRSEEAWAWRKLLGPSDFTHDESGVVLAKVQLSILIVL